jgi:peptide/nickel transport system substrate-binding protein
MLIYVIWAMIMGCGLFSMRFRITLVLVLIADPLLAANGGEVPLLAEQVKAGLLLPVAQRLPKDPALVDVPGHKIGKFGGQLEVLSSSVTNMTEMDFILIEPLIRFQADGKTLAPNLAREWKIADEGRSITIFLREGMRWSDGQLVTMEDVLFAWNDVICNNKITPVMPPIYVVDGQPMRLQPIDDFTFELRFSQPYGAILYALTRSILESSLILPKHYLRQFHPRYRPESEIKALAMKAGYNEWYQLFNRQNAALNPSSLQVPPDCPVLTAWKVRQSPAPNHVILERNPYYWKVDRDGNQLPYIDRIHSECIANPEVRNLKLISGQVDLGAMEGAFDTTPLFLSHAKNNHYRVCFWTCNWGSRVALYLNQTHPDLVLRKIFQEKEFRIALSLGINREEINKVLYFGRCTPRQLTVNPVCSFFQEGFDKVYAQYDPALANRKLDALGLKRRQTGGWRYRPDGKVLAISCEVYDGGFRPQTTELIKEYWEELGILVDFRVINDMLWLTRYQANALDLVIVPDDVATDITVLNTPVYMISYWAPLWSRYLMSEGKQGERPPPLVWDMYNCWKTLRGTTDPDKRLCLGRWLIGTQAENL